MLHRIQQHAWQLASQSQLLCVLLLNHLLPAAVCSVAAVVLGQLPGDWGFFSAYLTGGIVLGVLAVGSTAPGLLQVRYTGIILYCPYIYFNNNYVMYNYIFA
jgi:hypothetical protein